MQNAKYTVPVLLDIICWEMQPANKSSETPYSDVMLFLAHTYNIIRLHLKMSLLFSYILE